MSNRSQASNAERGFTTTTSLDWQRSRGCAADPETHFPRAKDRAATEAAVAICSRCPVRLLCLQWALDTRSRYGVWGGLSELDRQALHDQAENVRLRSPRAWVAWAGR